MGCLDWLTNIGKAIVGATGFWLGLKEIALATINQHGFWVICIAMLAVRFARRHRAGLREFLERWLANRDLRFKANAGAFGIEASTAGNAALQKNADAPAEPLALVAPADPPPAIAAAPVPAAAGADAAHEAPADEPLPGEPEPIPAANLERLLARVQDATSRHLEEGVVTGLRSGWDIDLGPELARPSVRALLALTARGIADHDFEQIYGLIFEAQTKALRALSAFDQMPRADLGAFHAELVSANGGRDPLAPGTFLGWLELQRLIRAVGVSDYEITPKGRSFLAYLSRANRPPKHI